MKIGITGCTGRMGRMLSQAVVQADEAELIGGTEAPGSPHVGSDLAALIEGMNTPVLIGDDARALFEAVDVVIDFTMPTATAGHAKLAGETGTAMVIGTTGLSPEHQQHIEQAAEKAAIVQAANYSVGVNLLLGLTEQTAAILGEDYDIEVLEMHHRHKVDAPSGTALAIGQAAANGRGVDLESVSQRVRDGITGERKAGDIGFATLRGGDVVGDHSIMFAAGTERLELTHKASHRSVFANGAVRAGLWAGSNPPGLYSMRHVLGFE